MKTILLENNEFMWTGLEDFCKSFDPNYVVYSTSIRNHDFTDDLKAAAMLAQPTVERLIVASAFESSMFLRHIGKDKYWQVEHYLKIIWAAYRVREMLGSVKLYIEINYHGIDFLQDIKDEKWGWDFSASIKTFVRQNPDNLIINVYDDYKFKYRLTEENMYAK